MRITKPFFSAVGSGAGVAWPTFGILFSVFGFSTGGILSIQFGCFCLFLFLVISIPIFYWVYQDIKAEDVRLQAEFQKNKRDLELDLNNYFDYIHAHFEAEADVDKIISQDVLAIGAKKKDSAFHHILQIVDENKHTRARIFEKLSDSISQKKSFKNQSIKSAFFSFVGTFGAIAGWCAGVSGPLTGVGIFTTFANWPLLGAGIIGVACISGILTAIEAYTKTAKDAHTQEQSKLMSKMHRKFEKANLGRSLPLDEAEEQRNIKKIYAKTIQKNKPVLHFPSLFTGPRPSPSPPESVAGLTLH